MTKHNSNFGDDSTEGRTYFSVEPVHAGDGNIVNEWECENALGVASVLQALENTGELGFPTEIRIMKMTRLDAPLTDEEQENLDSWIENVGEDEALIISSDEQDVDEEPEFVPYLDDTVDTTELADGVGIDEDRLYDFQAGRAEPNSAEKEAIERELSAVESAPADLHGSCQDSDVPSAETENRLTPLEGGLWYDPEHNPDFGDGYVNVVEVPGDTADEWPVPGSGTVFSENDCDRDEPVVVATYCDGNDKHYSFPISRLQPTCVECGAVITRGVRPRAGEPACNWCGCHLEGATFNEL